MYPYSPQEVAQEFLTIQLYELYPTRVTAWLMLVPHLLKTPLEYNPQLLASTQTETGYLETAD